MRAWWEKYREHTVLVLSFMAMLTVLGLCAWEWVTDMSAVP